MARPFDDRVSSPYVNSSISSQTSLAADRVWVTNTNAISESASKLSDDAGRGWSPWRGATAKAPPPTTHGSKLAKIKSSPSFGALNTVKTASGHGKLHKRGDSASASQCKSTSTIASRPSRSNVKSAVHPKARVEPYHTAMPKVMIKPLLRKLSAPEPNAIDLSRSPAENEALGLYTSSEISRDSDENTAFNRQGGYHHRNASDHSYVSTTSAHAHRFGTQYVHPMKQTPRPYTPPAPPSHPDSMDSQILATGSPDDANRREFSYDKAKKYLSRPTLQRITPDSNNPPVSYMYLANSSQTNLPTTPSSLRFHTEYIEPRDMMLLSTRSSLESAFRTRNRAHTDPAAQAATVAALRQQFNEKEAVKELKYQQVEARKKEKREEEERRKSEGINRKRAKSNNTTSEKSANDLMGEYNHPSVTELFGETASGRPSQTQTRRRPMEKAGGATKAVQSQWSLFWFKCKIVWLKLKKRVSRSSN